MFYKPVCYQSNISPTIPKVGLSENTVPLNPLVDLVDQPFPSERLHFCGRFRMGVVPILTLMYIYIYHLFWVAIDSQSTSVNPGLTLLQLCIQWAKSGGQANFALEVSDNLRRKITSATLGKPHMCLHVWPCTSKFLIDMSCIECLKLVFSHIPSGKR